MPEVGAGARCVCKCDIAAVCNGAAGSKPSAIGAPLVGRDECVARVARMVAAGIASIIAVVVATGRHPLSSSVVASIIALVAAAVITACVAVGGAGTMPFGIACRKHSSRNDRRVGEGRRAENGGQHSCCDSSVRLRPHALTCWATRLARLMAEARVADEPNRRHFNCLSVTDSDAAQELA